MEDSVGMTEELDDKYMTRRECDLKDSNIIAIKLAVDNIVIDVGDIKENIAAIVTWRNLHSDAHEATPGAWKKAQIYAVIAAVIVASMSLLTSTVFGIITLMQITGKP